MSAPATVLDRADALLAERSAALAHRGREHGRSEEARVYLVCACGGERLGLPLAEVAGVLAAKPCTPVPGAPGALRGIVALSGGIVSVIDLAAALGLPRGEAGHFVRLRAQEPPVALAVGRVLGIAQVQAPAAGDSGTAATGGLGADGVSGYAPPGPDPGAELDGGFAIVDLPRLLRRFLP